MVGKSVTPEEVKENMQEVWARTVVEFGKPCTYVTVKMKNGFTLRESTTCVDPANYDEEIGKRICLQKIEDKVWFLLGYQLQEEMSKTPSDYRERMKKEYFELKERYMKLEDFNHSEAFKGLHKIKQDLLLKQQDAMKEYMDILGERCQIEGAIEMEVEK